MTTGVTPLYNDLHSLAGLRAQDADPEAATREAAKQFEALFVQMMLESMRSANAILGEERDTTYEEMFDKQIAVEITRNNDLGIADLMLRQLAPGLAPGEGSEDAAGTEPGNFVSPRYAEPTAFVPGYTGPSHPLPASRRDWRPDGTEAFVRELMPHAQQAAERLGVDPRVLVAQAALETGWGKYVTRDSHGVSSNNVFNIKANRHWSGPRVRQPTLEFVDGVHERRYESFRLYDDLAHGFEDYVNLISRSPRYAEALEKAADPDAYVEALQEAGYATDPEYAAKIRAIFHGEQLGSAVAGVKNSG